jgi:hypothetical protein
MMVVFLLGLLLVMLMMTMATALASKDKLERSGHIWEERHDVVVIVQHSPIKPHQLVPCLHPCTKRWTSCTHAVGFWTYM